MRPLPPLERIDYVTGCDLLRRDLAGSVAYEARLLALHVATVHRTWGVGRGLTLTLSSDEASATVGAGFGFTCRGEPIVLARRVTIAAPRVPAASITRPLFDLILTRAVAWSFAGDAAVDPIPPLGHAARDGNAIPLGRFELRANGTLIGPDLGQRRVARGPVRPYIGVAMPGSLTWEAGSYRLTADVETTSAHFSTTPTYLVTLGNSPWDDPTLLGPLVSIVGSPSATSFTLQLLFAKLVGDQPTDFFTDLAKQASALTVSWIGLENTVGCG